VRSTWDVVGTVDGAALLLLHGSWVRGGACRCQAWSEKQRMDSMDAGVFSVSGPCSLWGRWKLMHCAEDRIDLMRWRGWRERQGTRAADRRNNSNERSALSRGRRKSRC
jgi:hypothetical protein